MYLAGLPLEQRLYEVLDAPPPQVEGLYYSFTAMDALVAAAWRAPVVLALALVLPLEEGLAQGPAQSTQELTRADHQRTMQLLGVTSVDPEKYDLLFSRFVSDERSEPPDIDVDFEHERRE